MRMKHGGQKDVEFEKFKQVARLSGDTKFEVVINKPLNEESNFNPDELESLGWTILEPQSTVGNITDYKNFILHSSAEFGVAKETYVKSNSGWFSCRSACYLAAGKPVIAQDTRWSKYIPAGEGLFAFTDITSAVDAISEARSRYDHHSRKAKEIAHEYFDSNIVLNNMLLQLN